MAKIAIKCKDTDGSFFIASQGLSVNRSNVIKVEEDDFVRAALKGGAIEKATELEYDAAKKRTKYNEEKAAAANEKKYEDAVAKKQAELDALKAKGSKEVKETKDTEAAAKAAEAKAKKEAEAKAKEAAAKK